MKNQALIKLKKDAQEILKKNIFRLGSDTGYTAASGPMILVGESKPRFLYPFQWLWDTFFIAGWSQDLDQDIFDVQKFLSSQADTGFLGHIRYNREILKRKEYFPGPEIYFPKGIPEKGEITSKITQPPNVAYGVWELSEKIIDHKKKQKFLESVYPKIFKYHQYLYSHLVHQGLMVTIHPWAAGDDNSPKWDSVYTNIKNHYDTHKETSKWLNSLGLTYERVDIKLIKRSQRPINPDYDIYLFLIKLYNDLNWDVKKILKTSPFRVCEPLTNSVLLRSNLCLRNMALALNHKEDLDIIDSWTDTTRKALEKLYDPSLDLYYSLDLNSKKTIKVPSVSGLLPLFSLAISPERAAKLALNLYDLHNQYPKLSLIPSTFPSDPNFNPNRYWRGPSWIITNTLISDGLRHYGHYHLANLIDEHSLNLVESSRNDRGGFFEYFNPLTKAGLGSPLQSWTAASVLKICQDKIVDN